MSRVGVALRMGLQEYRRTTVLLEILVAAPADVIVLFSLVVPTTAMTLELASGAIVTAGSAGFVGAYMTPMAGAIIGGITGLFVMQTTRETDERLVISGYRPYQVIFARLGVLGASGVLVTAVSLGALLLMGVLVTDFFPAQLGWFAVATLLTVLVYGMVGVLAGSVLDTLSGVYLMLFIPMIDMFFLQNPLAAESPTVATFLPGNFPMQLAMDAAFTGNIEASVFGWALVYLLGITLLAAGVLSRAMKTA